MGNSTSDILKRISELSLDTENRLESQINLTKKDTNALCEEEKYNALVIGNKLKSEELKGKEQDREQRKSYSDKVFYFLCAYMVVVFVILILSACGVFMMEKSVLITLLSTTSANIIGLFVFVVRYLFNTEALK